MIHLVAKYLMRRSMKKNQSKYKGCIIICHCRFRLRSDCRLKWPKSDFAAHTICDSHLLFYGSVNSTNRMEYDLLHVHVSSGLWPLHTGVWHWPHLKIMWTAKQKYQIWALKLTVWTELLFELAEFKVIFLLNLLGEFPDTHSLETLKSVTLFPEWTPMKTAPVHT